MARMATLLLAGERQPEGVARCRALQSRREQLGLPTALFKSPMLDSCCVQAPDRSLSCRRCRSRFRISSDRAAGPPGQTRHHCADHTAVAVSRCPEAEVLGGVDCCARLHLRRACMQSLAAFLPAPGQQAQQMSVWLSSCADDERCPKIRLNHDSLSILAAGFHSQPMHPPW